MLRLFRPLRISPTDLIAASLRTANLLLSGTGNTTFQMDSLLPSSFVIREMVCSGSGTITIGTATEDKFSIAINGPFAFPLQSMIPIIRGEGMQVTFTGTGAFFINLLGFLHTA